MPGAVHVATEGSRVAAAQVRRCAGGTYCVCVCPRCSPPPPGLLRALVPQGMRVSPGRARAEGDGGGGGARYVVWGCHRTAGGGPCRVCACAVVSTVVNSVVLLWLLCVRSAGRARLEVGVAEGGRARRPGTSTLCSRAFLLFHVLFPPPFCPTGSGRGVVSVAFSVVFF